VSGVSRQWGSESPAGGAAAQGGSPFGGKAQLRVGRRARRGIQKDIIFIIHSLIPQSVLL